MASLPHCRLAAAACFRKILGAFLRHLTIGTPSSCAIWQPQVDRADLARVLAALGRFGSNVNQFARAANAGAVLLEHELAGAAARLEMRDMLMRALGRTHGH